jgi:hypothetical protein
MKDSQYAPWELEQEKQKRIEERKHFTRAQWGAKGRYVVVPDSQSVKVIPVRSTGNTLHLFSEEQTVER